ncbi:MAG: polysaccharide deacetylase family protein [Bacteroidaceae bacterium]|nr:polysaccharide deacetylase family protein [Bacteroidaceae bacterium]
MFIEQPARFLRWIYPNAVWRMDPSAKAVYLTFDDGPIPEATPFVLATLARYGVRATFFVVGDNVRKHPDVFRAVVAAGHRIGNHTFNHIGGFRWHSNCYLENTEKAQRAIDASAGGEAAPLFRPPHGWMRPMQYRIIRASGYRIIMWDLVTRDYSRRLTAEEVLANVKRYARNGSIITFHDSLRSIDKLRRILPEAIEWLLAEGYEFRLFD